MSSEDSGGVRGFERVEGLDEHGWRKLLGRKVSIRYKLHDDPAHPFSEAIGMVSSVASDAAGRVVVRIADRRGGVSEVPPGDVIAGKVWP